MGVPYTPEQLRKLGLIEVNGVYVKASSQVNTGKVEKIEPGIPMFNTAPMRVEISGGTYSVNGSSHTNLPSSVNGGDVVSVKSNRKIKNATKATNEQGIKFDSLLERYLYERLTFARIYFEFQKQYLLQDKFRYRDEAVRAITLTADFYLPTHNIIADTKGFQTQQGAMRWKMLKSVLKHIYDEQPEIVILKNRKDCDAFVNKLLYNA